MIDTEELREWESRIKDTLEKSIRAAQQTPKGTVTHLYCEHLANVADAELSMVQRLIRQSEENERVKK